MLGPTPRDQSSPLWQDVGLPLLIATIALIVSGVGLSMASLWVDEAYTWFFVSMDWPEMIQAVRIDGVNPPVYYIITKLNTDLLGVNEGILRLPSIIAHFTGTITCYWLGYRIGQKKSAIAASIFWGFHPMLLWFARDARPYAINSALAALAVLVFLTLQSRTKDKKSWLMLGFVTITLGLMTHYFSILIVSATALLSFLELRRNPAFFRSWTLIIIFAFIPLLLWLWWFLMLPNPSFGIGWISQPGFWDIPLTLWNLFSGYGGSLDIGTSVFGLFATVPLLAGLRRAGKIAVVGIALPILGVWMLSQFRPVYVDRYFSVILPFLVIVLATGVRDIFSSLPSRVVEHSTLLHAVSLFAVCCVFLAGLSAIHFSPTNIKEDWQSMTGWLNANPKLPVFLSEEEIRLPLNYYGLKGQIHGTVDSTQCENSCFWVLRQPYTATHAFSQAIAEPNRPSWQPELPIGCQLSQKLNLERSGLVGWQLDCDQ